MEKELERISIFIDGSNFYNSLRKILEDNEKINYQKLINILTRDKKLVNIFYYIAHLDKNINAFKYKKHDDFLKHLSKIPKIIIRLCNLKRVKINNHNSFVVKGDDIQLAQDIIVGAFDNLYDVAIIVSGDEDFISIIDFVRKRFKKKVINAYFRSSSSYKLKNSCDYSIKLNKILSEFIDKTDENNKSSSVV